MRYTKVKISFRYAPDRLYRVLLVPDDIDLGSFAHIIGEAFHVAWEHMFEFRKGNVRYVLDTDDYIDDYFSSITAKRMDLCDLSELGQKAVFEYDFGDGWEFDVKIYKRTVEKDDDRCALILDGAGQGVWEDNIYSLYGYFDGEVDGESKGDEESGYYLPWNFDDKCFSDFDKPLNLEEEQDYLDAGLENEIIALNETEEGSNLSEGSILKELFALTEDVDLMGTNIELQVLLSEIHKKLKGQYGEPLASMLVMRMLLEEENALVSEEENMA